MESHDKNDYPYLISCQVLYKLIIGDGVFEGYYCFINKNLMTSCNFISDYIYHNLYHHLERNNLKTLIKILNQTKFKTINNLEFILKHPKLDCYIIEEPRYDSD